MLAVMHGGSDALALSNVSVKFLPANTTSHLQSFDGGIIQVEILPEVDAVHVDTCMPGTALANSA